MGRGKENLIINGCTFLERICTELDSFEEKYLSVNREQSVEIPDYIRVTDLYEDAGPLSGIYSALMRSNSEALLAVACDMPFYGMSQARLLLESYEGDADLVVPVSGNRLQMMAALYGKGCLPVMEEMLSRGQHRLRDLTDRVRVKRVRDEDERAYLNVNTPEAYEALLSELR